MKIKLIGIIAGFIISLYTAGAMAPEDPISSNELNSNYIVKVVDVPYIRESVHDENNIKELNVRAYINQLGTISNIRIALSN